MLEKNQIKVREKANEREGETAGIIQSISSFNSLHFYLCINNSPHRMPLSYCSSFVIRTRLNCYSIIVILLYILLFVIFALGGGSSGRDANKKRFSQDPHISSFIHICIKRCIGSFVFVPVNVHGSKNMRRYASDRSITE